MEKLYIENEAFEHLDAKITPLQLGNYENCQFINCDFSNTTLSNFVFSECTFEACNLSGAKTIGTAFRDVYFKQCKLLGLGFDQCAEVGFKVQFEHCQLDFSSFHLRKLRQTKFIHSKLHGVMFTEADLREAVFEHCDLTLAEFESTHLEKADFRTAVNFSIDPSENYMKGARFSEYNLRGLLYKYDLNIE